MIRPATRCGQERAGIFCRSEDVAIEVERLKGFRLGL